MKVTHLALSTAALLALAAPGMAAIFYVDATYNTTGNTMLAATGNSFVPSTAASGTDGNWRSRAFASSGTVIESGGDNSGAGSALNGDNENTPRLVTTISGLTPGGLYNTFVYFWDSTNSAQHWRIRAGLTNEAGDLPLFTDDSSATALATIGGTPAAVTSNFSGFDPSNKPTVVGELSDRIMWQGALGQTTADSNGKIQLFVDDDPAQRAGITNGYNFRTWYDGVGYEAVPEPASFALLALGGSLLALRRRA